MRLRNIKNANEIINNSKYIVLNPTTYKGNWSNIFGNNNPIYIEIGMGKGQFILENALRYPDINFIGIEKYDNVLARAVKKIEAYELSNLKLIRMDAMEIEEIFIKEIDRIYLNFSDPWLKEKHAKRRLTSDSFLDRYTNIFRNKQEIHQKTDNENLFKFSCENLLKAHYQVQASSYNQSNMPSDNIMTEYEEKFLKEGNTIYKVVACRQ